MNDKLLIYLNEYIRITDDPDIKTQLNTQIEKSYLLIQEIKTAIKTELDIPLFSEEKARDAVNKVARIKTAIKNAITERDALIAATTPEKKKAELEVVLTVLFSYRNKIFHCGFRWPPVDYYFHNN